MWGRRAETDDPVSETEEELPTFRHDGDPAQALLNVLSRFQRHYLRGREGAEQSAWSDDCMNALIDAVDVAVAQRWQEVVSVLTETARVLQTYEDAERANECVPFLTSSHEVLCHMVGDLLAGQTRPGLLRKWEAVYERARADIDAAGLSLVQDEVSDQELAYEAFAADIQKNSPFDEPSSDIETEAVAPEAVAESVIPEPQEPEASLPFELPGIAEDVLGDPFEAPSLDDLPDLSEQEAEIPTMENAAAMEPEAESSEMDAAFEQRILSFPSRPASEEPTLDTDDDSAEPIEAEVDEPAELEIPEPVTEAETPASVGDFFEDQSEAPVPTYEEEISGILDAACDALSNATGGLEAFEVHVRELEARAVESDWDGAAAACRSVLRLLEMLATRNLEPSDRFMELAYGFGGVYVESRESADTDEYRSFQNDCVTLLQEWMDDRPTTDDTSDAAPAPEPFVAAPELAAPELAPDTEGSDPALAELLETVRAAMMGGRAANAKLLMLEAAARIAHEQEGEAAKLVGDAERALNENSRALEEARNSVQKHENRVSETAAKVSEVQHGQEDHRRQALLLAERLDECRSHVESLDEQIRELQNRRADAESERLAAEDELNAARESEDEHEAQLEAMRVQERDARLRLEEERGRAKALQNSRGDLERAVMVKREMLARQRQSTHDIEQTIAHTRDSEADESTEDHDSLF